MGYDTIAPGTGDAHCAAGLNALKFCYRKKKSAQTRQCCARLTLTSICNPFLTPASVACNVFKNLHEFDHVGKNTNTYTPEFGKVCPLKT